jgi:antitoxin FitA
MERNMPDLILRNVEERMVAALRTLASQHGRSAEAEHRELLAAALSQARRKRIAEVLAAMANGNLQRARARTGDDTG